MKFIKLILFFSFLSVFSQSKKIDSLELALKNKLIKDIAYVDLLTETAISIYPNDNKKVLDLANNAIILSDSLNYLKGKAEAYYIIGKVETMQLKLDIAIKTENKALNIFKKINSSIGIAKAFNQFGVIYFYRNENDKAIDYLFRAIETNIEKKGESILAYSYNNIGLVYSNKQKPEKALEYFFKSLSLGRSSKDSKHVALTLNNIGLIYNNRREFDRAYEIYEECLFISKKNNDKHLIAYASLNLAIININKSQYKKALSQFFYALKIHEDIGDNSGVCYDYNGIGSTYINLEQFDLALLYIKKSEKIAIEHDFLNHKMRIDEILSEIYERKKDYKTSLQYYKMYHDSYDSINKFESNNRFINLEEKYSYKEKELLVKENEIKLNQKIDQTNKKLNETKRQILYGLILVLFLFVVLGFVVYNARIKRLSSEYQKVVLKQKLLRSQMKPHFIFNSLSVLQGIVLHKEYDKASTYISKFSRLLREILETSKEEIINLETEIRIIENYIFLQYISHNSNCSYKITIDEKIDVKNFYIPPMIVQPIVENSFEHGFIELNKAYELSIDFELVNRKLVCTIIDNGAGLNDSNNKNYFEKKKSVSSTIIKERLELFSKKYGEKYSFKVIDRTLKGHKGTKVILLLPYKTGYND